MRYSAPCQIFCLIYVSYFILVFNKILSADLKILLCQNDHKREPLFFFSNFEAAVLQIFVTIQYLEVLNSNLANDKPLKFLLKTKVNFFITEIM